MQLIGSDNTKNNSETNQKVLKEAITIFYPNDKLKKEECLDFMGYAINDYNMLTLHHITKAATLRSQGLSDVATIDNCACLGDYSHQALHYIETLDKDLYDDWNILFLKINHSRKEFTKEFMDEIVSLQTRSMEVIDNYNMEKSRGIKR